MGVGWVSHWWSLISWKLTTFETTYALLSTHYVYLVRPGKALAIFGPRAEWGDTGSEGRDRGVGRGERLRRERLVAAFADQLVAHGGPV